MTSAATKGAVLTARKSGLQRQVIYFYRRVLRESRGKDLEEKKVLQNLAKEEFRSAKQLKVGGNHSFGCLVMSSESQFTPELFDIHSLWSVDDILKDYEARRGALIRALTDDLAILLDSTHPDDDTLCLYGMPDGTWTVCTLIAPEGGMSALPPPISGINCARVDGQEYSWALLVAHFSDLWLLSVAYYHGCHLTKSERMDLFKRINDSTTVSGAISIDLCSRVSKYRKGKGKATESISQSLGDSDHILFDQNSSNDGNSDEGIANYNRFGTTLPYYEFHHPKQTELSNEQLASDLPIANNHSELKCSSG